MRLASFRTAQGASYGAVTNQGIVDLGRRLGNRYSDLRALLERSGLEEARKAAGSSADYKESEVTWLPVIPNPGKIVCVGLNYEEHRQETGRDKTEQPALFLRLAESQVGHQQPILRPRESKNLDYEAEIALVIGTGVPGGAGARRNPPVWMKPGDKVEVEIDKVGVLVNTIGED